MKRMSNFIKVLFASFLVFSFVAFINPTTSNAQTTDVIKEDSVLTENYQDKIQRADQGETAYYISLMLKYRVYNDDNVWTWHKGNWGHQIETLEYHYKKHKNDRGINSKDMSQYMRQALEFKRNLKGAKVTYVSGDTPNVYKHSKNGKYIMIHKPTGLIVSFGAL